MKDRMIGVEGTELDRVKDCFAFERGFDLGGSALNLKLLVVRTEERVKDEKTKPSARARIM